MRDGQRGQREVVGQKDVSPACFGIAVYDAAHGFGVVVLGVDTPQHNGLVASQSGRFVDGTRVASVEFEVAFGPRDKKAAA